MEAPNDALLRRENLLHLLECALNVYNLLWKRQLSEDQAKANLGLDFCECKQFYESILENKMLVP